MIAAIGAVAANGMIGLNNWLPWDIPEELAYFEATVAGAALVIGRLTYESMDVVPEDAFIVTRQTQTPLRPGCHACATVEEAIRRASATGKNVFILGGASIYATAWPYCERFYLTRIDAEFAGDTRLPDTIPFADWPLIAERSKIYRERKSGQLVTCRFLQYENSSFRPVLYPKLLTEQN